MSETIQSMAPLAVARWPEVLRAGLIEREKVGAAYLYGLAIVVHLLTGGCVALAAALTSEIVLFTTFWHGFFLGGVMYGLIIIVLGTDEDV